MEQEIWINLSSNNLPIAKEFFCAIGFEMNQKHQAPHMVSMVLGSKKLIVNLFEKKLFQEFIGGQNITDCTSSNEVLFSIGMNSPEEVDNLARKVTHAGGIIYGKPGYKDGWMYGCGFIDLDGHRWNALYMDMSKFPKM